MGTKICGDEDLLLLLPKSDLIQKNLMWLPPVVSPKYESGGGGGWWWSSIWRRDGEDKSDDDDQEEEEEVFKVDNLGGGSNDDDDLPVFKLDDNLGGGFPSYYYNFCNKDSPKGIVGSSNGLVCVYDRDQNKVSLWNPATRHFRVLPESINIGVVPCCRIVSFGFDAETKDYKVVLLTGKGPMLCKPIECLCRVQVYSLSTDSWRLLEGITCLPGDPFCSYPPNYLEVLYLNGSCFFLAQFLPFKWELCFPENDRFIISLDLTKEIITPIQLPDHHRHHSLYLSYLGDDKKIALFTAASSCKDNYWMGGYQDFNIWVLNYEHGSSGSGSGSSMNKDFWTKLHSFRIEPVQGEWNLPRGISNDGKFALLETMVFAGLGKKMNLYNLVTKELKRNFLSCNMVMSKADAYKPSLVSIID